MRIYNGNDQPYTVQNPEVQNLRQSSAFDFSLSQDFVDCKTVRIFAYSSTREQSNKRSGKKLKTERLKTLTPRFTDFFTDFEKKTDCFAV